MLITPRRGLTVRLLVMLVLVGACAAVGGRQGAAGGVPPTLERLGLHFAGGQAAVVAPRIPGWLELVERRDGPAGRGLSPVAAGLPEVLLLGFAAAWWLVGAPASRGWAGDARRVARPRAPPGSLQLV